jgi:hypothetical protein
MMNKTIEKVPPIALREKEGDAWGKETKTLAL